MHCQLHDTRSAGESRCRLYNEENKLILKHYISECHVIQPLRPPNMRYKELYELFISYDALAGILIHILNLLFSVIIEHCYVNAVASVYQLNIHLYV